MKDTAVSLEGGNKAVRACQTILAAPGNRFFDELRIALPELLDCIETGSHPVSRSWYDSFDSRLRTQGQILEYVSHGNDKLLMLRPLGSSEALRQMVCSSKPANAQALPDGVFQRQLEKISGTRSLLPVASTSGRCVHYACRDSEGKSTLRIELEAMPLANQARQGERLLIWLRPVRGHAGIMQRAGKQLQKLLECKPLEADPVYIASPSSQFFPKDYSTKIRVQLDPQERSDIAVARLLHELLQLKKLNEEGMQKKLDCEFLHDFRIAIRQSRSLLAQLQGVYPDREISFFKKEFAWLASRTSDLRDYDVFLQKFERYAGELGAEQRPQLEPLRSYLLRAQKQAQRQLKRTLTTVRYRKLMGRWEDLVNEPRQEKAEAHRCRRPVLRLANDNITQVYKKVLRQGSAITTDSDIEAYHDLRKTAKKLRYLIECFATLYGKKNILRVTTELTRLQNVLGNLTDLDVQQALLQRWSDDMRAGSIGDDATQQAISTLQEILVKREVGKRKDFLASFARFASNENKKLYRKLFSSQH